MDFKPVSLFGGALALELPATFADVSTIREVPDHQEVYLDAEGYTNVIIEILERVDKDKAPTDEDATKYHLNDIVSTETDETRFWGGEAAHLSKLPETPAYTLFTSQHVDRNAPGRQSKEDFTATLLTLVRLEKQKTDILLVVNVPHLPGQYNKDEIDFENRKLGKLTEDGVKIRQRILETFEIKDYNLFVNDDMDG
ncbi:uncharacterized protein PV09_07636 [Verruconis gallopava]|uniref:Mog1p/PsbP-like protein n=1 Tax=Verruconis gallopava TaxID=253628 RepID=A0A0D2A296_9PEZI|nr:uncharacterized protein PV09_07636 [Verruconis gallopava]KIW00883.1 hypothetical protein PV09_07636 [Verruconis gallopava]